jgi:glucan biosynthesis protein C
MSRPSTENGAVDPVPVEGTERLYYLDWLRVLAIIGVFVIHAMHPFGNVEWHIQNPQTSRIITLVFFWLFASWGIALFFLISGAVSWIALQRREPSQFFRARTMRLLVPFIVGTLLFSVVQIWYEYRLKSNFRGSVLDFVPTFLETRATGLDLVSPKVFGDWGLHLWFLGFLFAFSLVAIPVARWLRSERGQHVIGWTASATQYRLGLVGLAVPLIAVRLLLQPVFPEGDDWSDFVFLMAVFVLGLFLFSDKRFIAAMGRDWLWLIGMGAFALVVFLASARAGVHVGGLDAGFVVSWSARSIAAWCLSIGLVGLGMHRLNFPNRFVGYSMEVIVPFYVIHHPVVIAVAFYVVQWDMNLYAKAPIVVVTSFVLTMVIIEVAIRRFSWTRLLFGMPPAP